MGNQQGTRPCHNYHASDGVPRSVKSTTVVGYHCALHCEFECPKINSKEISNRWAVPNIIHLQRVLAYKRAGAGADQTLPPALAGASGGEVTAQSPAVGDRSPVGDIILRPDGFLAIRHLPPGADFA